MLTVENKADIIKKYQKKEGDTGSTEVQIALLSARISDLQSHFALNKKDHHSRRGLLKMVSRRRRLLEYFKRTNFEGYRQLIADLGLRR